MTKPLAELVWALKHEIYNIRPCDIRTSDHLAPWSAQLETIVAELERIAEEMRGRAARIEGLTQERSIIREWANQLAEGKG